MQTMTETSSVITKMALPVQFDAYLFVRSLFPLFAVVDDNEAGPLTLAELRSKRARWKSVADASDFQLPRYDRPDLLVQFIQDAAPLFSKTEVLDEHVKRTEDHLYSDVLILGCKEEDRPPKAYRTLIPRMGATPVAQSFDTGKVVTQESDYQFFDQAIRELFEPVKGCRKLQAKTLLTPYLGYHPCFLRGVFGMAFILCFNTRGVSRSDLLRNEAFVLTFHEVITHIEANYGWPA